ncbi:MAG: patatin-like phospholipase family protein [Hyphomicrobiaceae bacterium]
MARTLSGHEHWHWPDGPGVKRVNIALQGGGSHGAFTWGVLDGLLADGRIAIEAISGTSAGAANAIVLAEGLMRGGPELARERLEQFWRIVSEEASASPIQRTAVDVLLQNWSLDTNPALVAFEMMSRVVSPYQFNPLNINPLGDLLEREIDFDVVRACDCMKLFISATNVHSGQVKVFTGTEVTAEAVMASACLPYLFQAVEIDGIPFWDGGFMGNPVLFPFLDCCSAPDVLIVQVNPIERPTTPKTAREIMDRVNEISFNAPLIKELRHVDFINRCLARGELAGLGFKPLFLHRVGGDDIVQYPASTKLNAEWAFLTHLRDIGRTTVQEWLSEHYDSIGEEGTLDIAPLYEVAEPASPYVWQRPQKATAP